VFIAIPRFCAESQVIAPNRNVVGDLWGKVGERSLKPLRPPERLLHCAVHHVGTQVAVHFRDLRIGVPQDLRNPPKRHALPGKSRAGCVPTRVKRSLLTVRQFDFADGKREPLRAPIRLREIVVPVDDHWLVVQWRPRPRPGISKLCCSSEVTNAKPGPERHGLRAF